MSTVERRLPGVCSPSAFSHKNANSPNTTSTRRQVILNNMEVLNDEKTIIQRIEYVLYKLKERSTEAEKGVEN